MPVPEGLVWASVLEMLSPPEEAHLKESTGSEPAREPAAGNVLPGPQGVLLWDAVMHSNVVGWIH